MHQTNAKLVKIIDFTPRCAFALGALAIWMAAGGCVNAPQPLPEPGWEQRAGSAAGAPMYFGAGAQVDAQPAGSATHTPSAQPGTQPESAHGRPARVSGASAPARPSTSQSVAPGLAIARAKLGPRAQLNTVPGPDATTQQLASWLFATLDAQKPDAWIVQTLGTARGIQSGASPQIVVQRADLDGDQKPDLIAAIPRACVEGADCPMEPDWAVMVVWADQTWSLLLEEAASQAGFVAATDFTGDGVVDPGLTMKSCGASTCFENISIFSTQLGQKNATARTAGATASLPRLQKIFDSNTPKILDGLNQEIKIARDQKPAALQLSGSIAGSVGAGPAQRARWTTWQWQPAARVFQLTADTWAPSRLRIHRLQDALIALENQDRAGGKKALQQVIDDPTLEDPAPDLESISAPAPAHAMRRQLAKVAQFELARIALADDNEDEYHRILGRLSAKSPDSPATRATRKLGQAFEKTRDAQKACLSAAEFIARADDKDWTLSPDALGYNASIVFDPRTLCPRL